MIVRCENCGTEFGFDDRQVGEGVTVRCSVCKHVFKVESPSAATQSWQIRTTEGMSFKAPDVATLREWIDEGRLHPDDQVSRTGRNWVRLGDMPEFARAFAGFQGLAPVAAPVRAADPARVQPAPSTAATLPASASQSQRAKAPQSNAPVAPHRPTSAPARTPARPMTALDVDDDDEEALLVDDDDELTVAAIPAAAPPTPARTREVSGPARTHQQSSPARTQSGPAPARESSGPTRTREQSGPAPAREQSGPTRTREQSGPARPARTSEPSQPHPAERSSPQARVAEPEPSPAKPPEPELVDVDVDDDEDVGKRRGIGPGLIALLGVVAAVGVMFGVPSIRTKLLSLGQGDASEQPNPAQRVPEIQAAEQALHKLGTAELARAEAGLQRAIDAGGVDATTAAAMKVALADLLLSRAIAYEIAAALDDAQRADFRRRAAEDQEDGKRLIDSLEGAPDVDRLAEVRALARLAAGRPEAEVLPLVPDGASETRLIVQAAVLWQDLAAPVPPGLVGGLTELPKRSGLGESTLALALVRAGDRVAARNVSERLLVGADDQIVALAVRSHLDQNGGPEDEPEQGETEGEPSEGETGEAVAKAPPPPDEPITAPAGESSSSSSSGSSGGASFDKLVERGCKQVRGGEAAAGIKTLLRAFDMKDNSLDVLVCLADGYAAQGQNTQAAAFYDRALNQSPANIPALRGAAKLAAKTGASERAKKLYERLLAADPDNATAQAYLAKHGAKPGAKPEAKPEPKPDKSKPSGEEQPPAEPSPEPATPPSG